MNMLHANLYGDYRTRSFANIFPDYETFKSDFDSTVFKDSITKTDVLYYLLYSRYGNSAIASSDENRFKYDLFGIIFSYGPTWEKKLEVQKKLRELSEEDLMYGAKAIYNTALNPSSGPTVNSDGTPTELTFINSQNTTNYKKSKLEAYNLLYTMLEDDVTTMFIDKFGRLFNQWGSEMPLYYKTVEDTDEYDT